MNRRQFIPLVGSGLLPPPFASRGFAAPPAKSGSASGADELAKSLDEIRLKHRVPALGAGLVTVKGLQRSAAAGVRKAGTQVPVTVRDLWHTGSMTKAMTATLLATFVESGALKWDDTLGKLLPKDCRGAAPAVREITVRQLLEHRSGLPANLISWLVAPRVEQRGEILRLAAPEGAAVKPGEAYLYSNVGYTVAGHIAERLGGKHWEELMELRVFKPLGMTAGYGPVGTPGKTDQPWPHDTGGQPLPDNGLLSDNPPSMGPAGRVHASLANYARFAADHLRGAAGKPAILKAETYTSLHTPALGGEYACGWVTAERPWAGGECLTHTGSNNANFFVAWLAPAKGFAVIAACNQAGNAAAKACDDACSLLIEQHLKTEDPPK
ncbi:MAG: serine hydrolase domain-containing protein [Verrucomicrobiota bacterium]